MGLSLDFGLGLSSPSVVTGVEAGAGEEEGPEDDEGTEVDTDGSVTTGGGDGSDFFNSFDLSTCGSAGLLGAGCFSSCGDFDLSDD